MVSSFTKVIHSIQRIGFAKTIIKIVLRPYDVVRRKKAINKLLLLASPEERFTWIYENNYWESKESVSGTGSTLKYTKNLREVLPRLIHRFGIKSILDAPCGDFTWMRHVLKNVDVRYVGGDIVQPLIRLLNQRYGSGQISFIHLDLISGKFPSADLMICRDCLFHLSYADTRRVLENYITSEIPYLLTTRHKGLGKIKNRDIETGDFRLIDLIQPPYNFPDAPLFRVDDWIAPDPEREMCLWQRSQVAMALSRWDAQ
jgi:hypothetical protein